MPTKPLSDELCQLAADAWESHGNMKAAAKSLNLHVSTYRNRLHKAAARGMCGTKPVIPGFEISKISTQLDEDGNVVKEHIQHRPERGAEFEVPSDHLIKGVSALVDAEGNEIQKWIKTKQSEIDTFKAIERSFSKLPPFKGIPRAPRVTLKDQLSMYPVADTHLGLQAFEQECGEDYNLDMALERFNNCYDDLFLKTPNSGTGLILNLGDFTHADDSKAMTPSSNNLLQVSNRQDEVLERGVDLLIEMVFKALRKHKKVIVKILKGNHDLNSWKAVYIGLKMRFRDNKRVKIFGGNADYWFFRWGDFLLGAHHGHRLKPLEMAQAMASLCRRDFGETNHHLFLHGHFHHEMVKEIMGVRVECMRTLVSADPYHVAKYTSGKSIQSITVGKQGGEDGRGFINLPLSVERAETFEVA